MDHIKKLVYIIVGCLTIVSLVFTLCHKVGHCAETPYQFPISTYFDEYPSDYTGGLSLDDYLNFIRNTLHISDSSYYISYYTFDNGVPYFRVVKFSGSNLSLYSSSNLGSNDRINITEANTRLSANQSVYVSAYSVTFYYIKIQNGNFTKTGESTYASWTFANSQYLFYSSADLTSGNDTCFYQTVERPDPGPNPHSKGAILGNYIDSVDLIEQDSSLPSVDTTPPFDTSSNPAWYQKILNGMGKINQSIKGGVLTIGDYLGQIKEDLENVIAWITETPDSNTILNNVQPYLAQNDLISGFLSSKTAIQSVYTSIGNVSAKTRNQMVWDIPFNLPSMSQTFHAIIDFGWYENIRSTLEPFLNMFLSIGFLFSLIRSIPGILHGNSGEGDT